LPAKAEKDSVAGSIADQISGDFDDAYEEEEPV
jgi:hypothetical protein